MQEAALLCLAALARDNAPVAAALSRGDRECQSCPCVLDSLSSFLQRHCPPSSTSQDPSSAMSRLQLRYGMHRTNCACKALPLISASFIIRASRASAHSHAHGPAAHYGHIPASTANDHAIRTVFNVVERLMALSPTDSAPIITKACYVFCESR